MLLRQVLQNIWRLLLGLPFTVRFMNKPSKLRLSTKELLSSEEYNITYLFSFIFVAIFSIVASWGSALFANSYTKLILCILWSVAVIFGIILESNANLPKLSYDGSLDSKKKTRSRKDDSCLLRKMMHHTYDIHIFCIFVHKMFYLNIL